MVVEDGQELGISIRGGAEHGLGVYISVVEEDSVAHNHGLKVNTTCMCATSAFTIATVSRLRL